MDNKPVVVAVIGVLAAAVLAGGGYLWWQSRTARPAPQPASPPAPVAQAPTIASPPAEPAIRYPVPAASDAAANETDPVLDAAALAALVGQKAVLQFLQTDGFAARVVASVDNLARPHAAPRLWPVVPTPGRFTVEAAGGGERVAASNAQRYAPFVRFLESVDSNRAATLYFTHYKLFQQAYAELGYPKGYFNDRLVDVIDHLLATPEPLAPPAVQLVEVKGGSSKQPWTRYEFVDERFESLTSGQKIMLRLGPDQERRVKAKLAEFRAQVAKPGR